MASMRSRREFVANAGRIGVGVALSEAFHVDRVFGLTPAPRVTIDHLNVVNVNKFVSTLAGRAVFPDDPGYEQAREVWNHAYDKRPGLIVFCADSQDVVRTLDFAQTHQLLLAIRSGRHSMAGKSTCEGGLVLDLSQIKSIQIDHSHAIARAGAGLRLSEFDHATSAYGMATTSGTEPTTGIAGLTLGGGLGWLMGRYGLACDNLRSVNIVMADGRVLMANDQNNEDLYWAVRGAGANFGVVTELEYDLHPVSTIYGGVIKYPKENIKDVLRLYREFTANMPEEVGISAGIVPTPSGSWLASLAVCYCGDLRQGESVLRPLRRFRPIVSDTVKPMPYVEYQALGGLPPGLKLNAFIRSCFLEQLSDAAIDVIAANLALAPAFSGGFVIERFHGKAARISATATAFPHRFAGHNFSLHGDWLRPQDESPAKSWVSTFWAAMQPYRRSAVYSNYLGDEGSARARASYGANYDRLVQLKLKYDPANLFCMNQNIPPQRDIRS